MMVGMGEGKKRLRREQSTVRRRTENEPIPRGRERPAPLHTLDTF